jgi:hypothetical protein
LSYDCKLRLIQDSDWTEINLGVQATRLKAGWRCFVMISDENIRRSAWILKQG